MVTLGQSSFMSSGNFRGITMTFINGLFVIFWTQPGSSSMRVMYTSQNKSEALLVIFNTEDLIYNNQTRYTLILHHFSSRIQRN